MRAAIAFVFLSVWSGVNQLGGANTYTHAFGLTAANVGTQKGCTQLDGQEYSEFSSVPLINSVCLAAPLWPAMHQIIDNDGANPIVLYPCVGCTINGGKSGAAFLAGVPITAAGVVGRVSCFSITITSWNCK